MKRLRGRTIAIVLALGVAALLGLAGYAARHRILEAWHLHRLESDDPAVRLEAIRMLGRVGSVRSVPGLGTILDSESLDERHAAIEALGSLGPMAVEAVPLLVKFLLPESDPMDIRTTVDPTPALVERTLERIGPGSIPSLSESLQLAFFPSRMATLILRFDGGIPHLISLLGHEDDRVRAAVRAALRSDRDRTVGPLLDTALEEKETELGRLAVHVLLTMGQEALAAEPAKAIDAFPRLNSARKEPLLERATCAVLAGILGTDAVRMQGLAAHTGAEFSLALRVTALHSIRRSLEQGARIVPDIIDSLLTDAECRQHAADTLALFGPPAVPALVDALAGTDAVGALWAESVLVDAGARRGPTASAIISTLPGKPDPIRRRIVKVLHATCETGAKALHEACSSPDEALRRAAMDALAEIASQ